MKMQDKKAKKSPPIHKSRPARTGLGRGLDALTSGESSPTTRPVPKAETPLVAGRMPHGGLTSGTEAPSETPAKTPGRAVLEIPVAEIERSPWQPRQTFDEEALAELANSIRSNGLIQPLICRKNGQNRFELIAGERRLRAAIDAGLTLVPVVLVEAEDRRAAEMAIVENIQRQDLNVIEEAEGYRTLVETFQLTQQEVSERVGKARSSVTNLMRLLELPDEVKQLVGNGLLSQGHAKVLLSLQDGTDQTLLARKAVSEAMSVRQLEAFLEKRKKEPTKSRPAVSDLPESYLRDLSDRLHRHFGTSIRIRPSMTHANGRHTKGTLEVDFYGNEDLGRILTLLGISLDS